MVEVIDIQLLDKEATHVEMKYLKEQMINEDTIAIQKKYLEELYLN